MIVYGLVLVVHVFVCMILVGVILLQGGRGGMSEALSGTTAQSLFGGGAATVLTRATAVCAGLFVVTCLSLAYLSTQRGRSVIEQVPMEAPAGLPLPLTTPAETAPPAAPAPATPTTPPVQSKPSESPGSSPTAAKPTDASQPAPAPDGAPATTPSEHPH